MNNTLNNSIGAFDAGLKKFRSIIAFTLTSPTKLLLSIMGLLLVLQLPLANAGYITNGTVESGPSGPGGTGTILYYGYGELYIIETFTSAGYIDTVWKPTSNPGTHINPIIVRATNSSGSDWAGFVFELGYGTGDGFSRSSSTDTLKFNPAGNTSVDFTSSSYSTDRLLWSGGTFANGEANRDFVVRIDVPDAGVLYDETGGLTFTFRQTPVPVPPAIWLFGSGMLGLAGIARRKKAA